MARSNPAEDQKGIRAEGMQFYPASSIVQICETMILGYEILDQGLRVTIIPHQLCDYVSDARVATKSIASPNAFQLRCMVDPPLPPAFVATSVEVVGVGVGLLPVFSGLAAAALLLALSCILEARPESVSNAST